MRRATRLLAIGGPLAVGCVLARPARAVDLTGTYDVSLQAVVGQATGTFTFAQSGTS